MNALPLILLPGTLCDARVWQFQAEALGPAREVRVCELGASPSLHEEVAALLRTLPHRFYLTGFSLGGIVAFEFLRQAPERVAGVALVASTARADPPESQQRRRELLARAEGGDMAGVVRDAFLPFYFSPSCAQREALTAQVISMAKRSAARFANQTAYASERPDSRPMLKSLTLPMLIMYGEDDLVIPFDRQTELVEAMPRARVCGLAGCGHFVPLEAPEACRRALSDWMETIPHA